jgi:trehalose utilization protein
MNQPAALRVLVWDEQQEAQKKAYPDFLGKHLAEHLKKQPGLEIRSVSINDPEQGLSAENLEWAEAILWWGHVRHKDVSDAAVAKIVERLKAGKTGLVAIHSAHWSKPFKAAMWERHRQDVLSRIPAADRASVVLKTLPKEGGADVARTELRDGKLEITLVVPNCGLGSWRADGAPSHIEVRSKDHPIAKDLPAKFDVKATEMYNEPFTVPAPDTVVFQETWDKGEKFRAGCCWTVGEGRVFYFRPGHETYPVFHQDETLRIVHNAALWVGKRT